MDQQGKRPATAIWRTLKHLLGGLLLVGMISCGGGSGDPPVSTQARVGVDGAHVSGAGGIVIDIPAGALDSSVDLQVTHAGDGHEPAFPDGFTPLTAVYTITPHIEPFGVPVTVSIPVPGVADGTALYVAIARPGKDWVLRPAVVSGGMATLLTTHFSYIVIGGSGHIVDSMSCLVAVGGCNPIPAPTHPIELYASENLGAAHPKWDGVLAIDKPTLLTFQSYIKVPASVGQCASMLIELTEENWVRQGGAWTLNFSRTFSHEGYGSAFIQPLPVDASMNGWLALEVTLTCEGLKSDGTRFPIWKNTLGINYDEVNIPTGSPPVITQQPLAQTVVAGQSATFSVTATGAPPLGYQWFKNGNAIAGATSSSYPITNAQLADSGSVFSVTVTDANGSVTSSSASLTVTAGIQITQQPLSQSVWVGQSATFSVGVTGTAPLSYQWSRDGHALTGAGATAQSYTFPNAQLTDTGAVFTVTVTDATGATLVSDSATLTVTTPTSGTTCTGSNSTGWCRVYDDSKAAVALGQPSARFEVNAIAFGSSSVGIAVSYGSDPGVEMLRTTDGGNTWAPVTAGPFVGAGVSLSDVTFADANTVVAIGRAGPASATQSKIYRSTDAGAHWAEVASFAWPGIGAPTLPGLLQSVRFTDGLHGVVSASDSFLRTSDGGATWALQTPDLSFTYNGTTYNRPALLTLARIPGTTTLVASVLDQQGQSPMRLLQSTDGGASWSTSQVLPIELLTVSGLVPTKMSFANASVAVMLGDGTAPGIWRSSDGGQTWSQVSGWMATNVLLNGDGSGVAVSPATDIPNIAYTADFGVTWQSALSGSSGALVGLLGVASPASGRFVAGGGNTIVVNQQSGVGP